MLLLLQAERSVPRPAAGVKLARTGDGDGPPPAPFFGVLDRVRQGVEVGPATGSLDLVALWRLNEQLGRSRAGFAAVRTGRGGVRVRLARSR